MYHTCFVIGFQLMVLYCSHLSSLLVQNQGESPGGFYKNAAVAADNGICSEIGKNILQKGGNAVEAVIATAICSGVVNPQSCGLGGGHFLTVYNKASKSCTIFDARERAPLSSSEKQYSNSSEAQIGWKSIAVPGEIHGFWTAYKQFGRLIPWQDLWAPSIKMCREGIPVSASLAGHLKDNAAYLENNTDFDIFKNPQTGKFFGTNETMKRLVLADTMEKLANSDDPVKLFYNSPLTTEYVDEIQRNGGFITYEDMKSYSTRFGHNQRPPIYSYLRNGLTMCGPPPPSSASLVASMVNVFDGYNLKPDMLSNLSDITLQFHRILESMKFAYGTRYYLGDMDYLPATRELAQSVALSSYGDFIRERISNEKSFDNPFYYGHSTLSWDSGTSQMTVVDEYGNAASMTSTINTYFGAKVMSDVTGVIYNDQMDDFAYKSFANYFNIQPSPANKVLPGKRPQSSMSPIVTFDRDSGQVKLAMGAAGGVKIISAVAQVAIRILYFNQTLKDAIDEPRLHNQLLPFQTFYEHGFPESIIGGLENFYKQIMNPNVSAFGSVVNGVHRLRDGTLEAASDWRKQGGRPAGY